MGQNNLEPTIEQQLLFHKLEQSKNDYIVANRERQEKAQKTWPPIFGIHFDKISPTVKLLYFFIVFTLVAAGILWALGRVKPATKEKKKKKN